MYVRIVYTQQGSVAVLQATGSLLILFLVYCCIVLCLRSYCELLPEPLFQLFQCVWLVISATSTVTVYRISGAMASGDSRPKADQSGIHFRNQLHVPWNAPESIVTLDSPGVVMLDTSAVPDVIGYEHVMTAQNRHKCYLGGSRTVFGYSLRTTEWLPGGSTLVDMAGVTGPNVSKEDLSSLRLLVAGMSKRQTDLELMRSNCKARFRANQTGACAYCGLNIVHDMARHVSSFHLD